MSMFIAKTAGRELVAVRALRAIAPQPGCKLARWTCRSTSP